MSLQVLPATVQERPILQRLMELYLYDFSEFDDADINDDGIYGYEFLDRYWVEDCRYPFSIRVDGKWAGFVLVRDLLLEDGVLVHTVAEFFVMRKYRRQKVGQRAAFEIFDRFAGLWRVGELRTNRPAQSFWRKIIREYTHGQFSEMEDASWDGPMQEFLSTGPVRIHGR
jgi:predicted acetyltransferase